MSTHRTAWKPAHNSNPIRTGPLPHKAAEHFARSLRRFDPPAFDAWVEEVEDEPARAACVLPSDALPGQCGLFGGRYG